MVEAMNHSHNVLALTAFSIHMVHNGVDLLQPIHLAKATLVEVLPALEPDAGVDIPSLASSLEGHRQQLQLMVHARVKDLTGVVRVDRHCAASVSEFF